MNTLQSSAGFLARHRIAVVGALVMALSAGPFLIGPAVATPATIRPAAAAAPPAAAATRAAAAATPKGQHPDLDGDGRFDLVAGGAGVLTVVTSDGVKHVVPEPKTDPVYGLNGFAVVSVTGDFNGDGYDDVAANDSWYGFEGGVVWVLFGGPHGTILGDGTIPAVELHKGLDGMPGVPKSSDFFGSALAAGDLTGDGVDDLVIGTMFEKVGGHTDAGTVRLVPGSKSGLLPAKTKVYSQNTPGVPGTAEYNDKFGSAVAVGDVTGDKRLDLAVGSEGENGRGLVELLPGKAGGPTGAGTTSVSAESLGIKARTSTGSPSDFGSTVTIGDLTGDGKAEVVASAPYALVGKAVCGSIAVLRGRAAGISSRYVQVRSQSSPGMIGICEEGDVWGDTLAIGDLTGDKKPELVIGAPVESVGNLNGGGAYTVLHRSSAGVSVKGSFSITENSPNVADVAELGDNFSGTLALADVNRDGRLDVIAGAYGEKAGPTPTGSVQLLISTTAGRPGPLSSAFTGNDFSPAVHGLGRSIAAPAPLR